MQHPAAQRHTVATTDEEEQLAISLAIQASLVDGGSNGSVPSTSSKPNPASSSQNQTKQPQTSAAGPSSASSSKSPPNSARAGQTSNNGSPQKHAKRVMHSDLSKCAGCGKSIWGNRLTALDRLWHPGCFVCGLCSKGIHEGGNSRFAIGHEDGWPYHMECYKLRYHPVCCVCRGFVPAQPDGRVEYKQQGFWKDTYCTRHASDGTPQCCSCSRFQPTGSEWPQLTDGRFVCLVCLGTLVMDTKDAQPLYQEVLSFYKNMGLPHPEVAPFMLVDAFTLNDYSGKEGKDVAGGPMFHVRGLTLATVYKSIPSIVRARGGHNKPGASAVSSVDTDLSQVMQSGGKIKCNVSAVLVLYGLPRLLTGCIIAHELMHAWLRMKHVAGLDQKVEEGLCQLMAYVWLENQANGLVDEDQQRLASFYAYQIREDTSEVYGDGFREAYEAFQSRGLTAVINDVLRRGRFS